MRAPPGQPFRIPQPPRGHTTPGSHGHWDLAPDSLPVLQEGNPQESGLVAHACECLRVHGSRKAGGDFLGREPSLGAGRRCGEETEASRQRGTPGLHSPRLPWLSACLAGRKEASQFLWVTLGLRGGRWAASWPPL